MKAIISNRIYMTVTPSLFKKLEKELTYSTPSGHDPNEFVITKNLKVINYKLTDGNMLVSIPVGRFDLIPDNYEIVDKRIERVIEDFPKFKFDLRESQQEVIDLFTDNCIINAKPGWGKAQPKGSKVRTTDGWVNIEDIIIGCKVVTPMNKVATVVDKFYSEYEPIYKITLQDGRVVKASGNHLWKTVDRNNRVRLLTTENIIGDSYFKAGRLYLPLTKPIGNDDIDLPIDPYLLGILLGDGCIITSVGVSTADIEVVSKLENILPDNCKITKIPNNKYDYRIISSTPGKNELKDELAKLKLLGLKSHEKFIPKEYLLASLSQKLQLIQGLLDSDGTVDKTGNKIEYFSTSKKLAEDFQYLMFSLGAQCPIRLKTNIKYTHNGEVRDGKDCYIVSPQRLPLVIKTELFSLTRKRDLIKAGQYDNSNKVKINKVELIGYEECWCISLDDEENLYLTDNYVVTHNTYSAIALASKLKQKTLVITHTIELRNQWEREIIKTLGVKPGIIGSGKFNTNADIVVANVQTLSKHVSKVSREFGLVILDEMHHVSSPTFSKVVDGMFSRFKVGLSGTIERKDGKHVVFKDYFSSTIFKPKRENVVSPDIHVVESGIMFSDSSSIPWANKVNFLLESPLYRNLIIKLADNYAYQGHKVLVVADRVEFLEYCHENCEYESGLLIGKTKNRQDIIDSVYNNDISIVWATQNMVSEGISIEPLSCLIPATPLNNMPLLEQLIGRIERLCDGKLKPVVVDPKLMGNVVTRQFNNRLGHYVKQGYDIKFIK